MVSDHCKCATILHVNNVKKNHHLTILGVTGGIGSGKSTVSKMFEELGAIVLDADKLCHKLLDAPPIKDKITNMWKEVTNNDSKTIDRAKLGEIVFANRECLEKLNKIIHPFVIKQIKEKIDELRISKKYTTVIIDAALLEESKLSSLCDIVIFVETDNALRVNRCKTNRNWNANEVEKREQFQLLIKTKKELAKVTICNNKSKDYTRKQVHDLWFRFIKNEHT